jgi:hypothetical protein
MDLSINNPTSWQWTFEGGEPSVSNEQNPTVTYNNEGTFRVSLTSQNSFGSDSKTQTGYILVSTTTDAEKPVFNYVSFYPNPVSDVIHFSSDEMLSVRIFDLNGKQLLAKKIRHELNLSDLKTGIYLLEIIANQNVIREKLIKQ